MYTIRWYSSEYVMYWHGIKDYLIYENRIEFKDDKNRQVILCNNWMVQGE